MDDRVAAVLIVICVALVLLPPWLDPAIRWKEYNEESDDR